MHYPKEKEADIPVALVAFFDDSFNANLHRFDWALASVLLKDNAALGCATFTEKNEKTKNNCIFFLKYRNNEQFKYKGK